MEWEGCNGRVVKGGMGRQGWHEKGWDWKGGM